MNYAMYPSYAEFVALKEQELKKEANRAAQRVVEEYANSPRPEFPIMLCKDVDRKINHILWRGIVWPFVKPRLHDDAKAIKCLISTIQNLYSDKAAWKELEGVGEEQLLIRYLELCPKNEWAINKRKEQLATWLEYTVHEWPVGVLYGPDGADYDQCNEILDAVQELRRFDNQGEYSSLCDDVEAKTLEYQKQLGSDC